MPWVDLYMRGAQKVNIEDYVDRNGLIKGHASWNDASGDGVLTTSIAGLLGVYDHESCDQSLIECIDRKRYLLMRRPDNSGGQQSHDGWMGLAVWLYSTSDRHLARRLLVSAVMRGLYMKHVPLELENKTWIEKLNEIAKPWMGRFPKIWFALLAAAFPNDAVRWFCGLMIRTLLLGSSVKLDDASGLQLQFLDRLMIAQLGNPLPLRSFLVSLRNQGTSISEIMARDFWDADHPVIDGYLNYEILVLTGGV